VIRFMELYGGIPNEVADHLSRLTAGAGTAALEEEWQQVTGSPLPLDIRKQLHTGPR
jgi:hypothetical protein